VAEETELPDDGVEEAAPLLVVWIDKVKYHRDVGLDVHHHESGRGGRLMGWSCWCGEGGRRSAGSRGGRAMVRVGKREEWIVIIIHGEQRWRRSEQRKRKKIRGGCSQGISRANRYHKEE
jgi:hypothetical protein